MEAEAPIRINTRENPHTKKMVDTITLFRREATISLVSSSIEHPQIKEKYDGMSGRTQGEKKDRRPAKSAAGKDTDSTNIGFQIS